MIDIAKLKRVLAKLFPKSLAKKTENQVKITRKLLVFFEKKRKRL